MNGLTYAYIGDAYYELNIRNYLIKEKKLTHVNDLHKSAIAYTSSQAQAHIITYFLDENMLTEDEIGHFKKGRNSSGSGRKNVDAKTYHLATGFESLLGYLYVHDMHRAEDLISLAIQYIGRG